MEGMNDSKGRGDIGVIGGKGKDRGKGRNGGRRGISRRGRWGGRARSRGRGREKGDKSRRMVARDQRIAIGWLLNVPSTCWCISGTDLLRQFYVLPH